MIQDRHYDPSIVVDITDAHDTKMEAIKCYKSQFHDPNSTEPLTYISKGGFLEAIEARAIQFGKHIGAKYAEGFICENIPGVADLDMLLLPEMA